MWVLAPDGSRLTRRFVAKNFLEAMSFLNDAAAVAERPDVSHHPDFHLTTYRTVEVVLWTHAAGGLTDYDFKLAEALGSVAQLCSFWVPLRPSTSTSASASANLNPVPQFVFPLRLGQLRACAHPNG